ncbi:ABC transporter substrate-binding protein [Sorangium cellulosum]|uniref:ABC transporter substrate-binding protein n=1 Tax=Sorangium cellulosum TaxID=56 RepID=A0A150RZH1_SORCE|nr:ABC transporter substrate-binding protein [Sorangium cellulosum]
MKSPPRTPLLPGADAPRGLRFLAFFRPLLVSLALLPAAGCGKEAPSEQPLTVGFIYVGARDDYGYNQAHAEGAAAVARLAGVKTREEENVPETVAVQKTIESMINLDGAAVIFPTSFGYFDPHILKVAEKFPDKTFLHCGGLYDASKHPGNVGSYFGYIDEAEYVAGIVAGMTTRSGKLGFIAAKPIPQVLRNINAFTLGVRSVNPKATTSVIFTGDWSMPVKEAEAANSLIDQGVDVLTAHVDSPRVIIELAERRGAFSTGYHTNQATLAPKGYLTGAEWNWSKVYTDYMASIREGKPYPHLLRGGFKEGFVKLSPYGPAVSEEAKKKAEEAKEGLTEGTLTIFKGPIKDNEGKVVVAEAVEQKQTDIVLENMSYLVDGVLGSVHQ